MKEPTPPSPAERAFAEYLDRLEGGEVVDTAAYLGGRPRAERLELERMIDDWHALRGRFGAESEPLDGTTSGGYEIGEALGQGGMGVVHVGRELATGREVALKVLAREHEFSDEAWKRFEREARLAAAISHPRCVFVYGVARVDGRPAIAMERMPGRTLQDELDEGRTYSVEEAVEVVLGVLDGLAAAYRAGIIHRDVKPANCFLDAGGGVKIGDFGISRVLAEPGDLTQAGQFLGSAHYASPEQARGASVTHATDVYSLGATLYALLTGRPPYAGGNLAQVLAAVLSKPVPDVRIDRPDVPERLARVLRRTMAKRPEARPRDLEELRAELVPFTVAGRHAAERRGRVGALDTPGVRRWLRRVERFIRTWRSEVEPVDPERVLDTDHRNSRGGLEVLGRYRVLGEVAPALGGRYLLGFDPALDRNVWLFVADEGEALPAGPHGGAMGLRFVETLEVDGRDVRVFEDPGGARLTAYPIRRIPIAWPRVRENLVRLSGVLEEPQPPRSLGAMWIDRNGDLRVLDPPLRRENDRDEEPRALFRSVARALLVDRYTGGLRAGPVSGRVDALQRRLVDPDGDPGTFPEVRAALEEVRDLPTALTSIQRRGAAALVLSASLALLALHAFRMAFEGPEAAPRYATWVGIESPILRAYVSFGVFCVLWAFARRGGLWLDLAGLELRLVDGRRVPRWRCLLRALVHWAVVLLYASWPFAADEAWGAELGENLFGLTLLVLIHVGFGPLSVMLVGVPAQSLGDRLPFPVRTCVVQR